MVTYPAGSGFTTLSLISSIGAGVSGLAMTVFADNLWISARVRATRRCSTCGRSSRPAPR